MINREIEKTCRFYCNLNVRLNIKNVVVYLYFLISFFSNFYHGLYKIPMIDQWGAVNGPTSGLRSWPQLSENVVVMVLNV